MDVSLKPYPVAGLPNPVLLPVPLVQRLIGPEQPLQFPGILLSAPYVWVQHETANPNPGMGALAHSAWMKAGCPNDAGQPTQTSWHFTVDAGLIVQNIDVRYVTWQAADGAGRGNMNGVSCELSVQSDQDHAVIRRNGQYLAAGVAAQKPIAKPDIDRHWDFNAGNPPAERHHCPDELMTEGLWPEWQAGVWAIMDGGIMLPDSIIYPEGLDAGILAELFGRVDATDAAGKAIRYKFDPNGSLSRLWAARGAATGEYPTLKRVRRFDVRTYWYFEGGATAWRPNDAAPVRWAGGA